MFGRETFRCIVTTDQQSVLAVDATAAIVPALDGQLGIWVDRAPFLAALASSSTLVVRQREQTQRFAISGGVACMRNNVLTVLADTCEPV